MSSTSLYLDDPEQSSDRGISYMAKITYQEERDFLK